MTDASAKWELEDLSAEGDSPEALRARILRRIVALSDADFGVWLTVHEVDGVVYYSPMQVEGDSQAPEMWRNVAGTPAAKPIQHSVRHPSREERESFQPVARRARLAGHDDPMDYSACRHFYAPHGVGDEARMLAFRDCKFVGWIGVFRWKDRPGFDGAALRALNASVDRVRAGLTAADHLDGDGDDSEAIYLLATSQGDVSFASQKARAWLTPARREDLRDVVTRFHRGEGLPVVVFHGMELQITRMEHDEGGTSYLLHLVAAPIPMMSPDALLTPTQREVAEYAAAGATVDEIARATGRSSNTVKYHLKSIYERLGVASRIELANALAHDPSRG